LGAHSCNLFELPFCHLLAGWLTGWLAALVPVTSGQSFINNDVIGCTGTHRRQRGQHTLHIYLKFYGLSGPGQDEV